MNRFFKLLVAGTAGWTVWSLFVSAGTPRPKYRILEKKQQYELREYEPYVVAETDVIGSIGAAFSRGFKKLFSYINGNNLQHHKLGMTAPVMEKMKSQAADVPLPQSAVERTVSFIMPPGSSVETLPAPNDNAVRLRQVPARKVAALRFGLNVSDARVEKKAKDLLAAVMRDHLLPVSGTELAEYNPPSTIPFLKRNEVLMEVKLVEV